MLPSASLVFRQGPFCSQVRLTLGTLYIDLSGTSVTSVALVLWRSFGLCFLRASITGGHCHAPLHSLHGLPRYLVTRVIDIYKLGLWPSRLGSGNVHHSKQVSGFLFHHGHLGLRWLLLVDTARADWGYEACHTAVSGYIKVASSLPVFLHSETQTEVAGLWFFGLC